MCRLCCLPCIGSYPDETPSPGLSSREISHIRETTSMLARPLCRCGTIRRWGLRRRHCTWPCGRSLLNQCNLPLYQRVSVVRLYRENKQWNWLEISFASLQCTLLSARLSMCTSFIITHLSLVHTSRKYTPLLSTCTSRKCIPFSVSAHLLSVHTSCKYTPLISAHLLLVHTSPNYTPFISPHFS